MDRKMVIGYTAAASILMIACMVYGFPTSVPDNAYTSHGLPFTWGRNQQITIAGPVDTWTVELNAMLIDLIFWAASIAAGPLMLTRDAMKKQEKMKSG
ncbi:hypothetical protein JXL21_03735 [Candidatus Bathyarchaeota archaeon]|nr:hypothetical protein [Candidatus Bathyarchaeota archaeon]